MIIMILKELLDAFFIKYHYRSKKIDQILNYEIEYYLENFKDDTKSFDIYVIGFEECLHLEKTLTGKNKDSWRITINSINREI